MASFPRSSESEALGRVWASEYFKDPQEIPIGSQGFQSWEPWLHPLVSGAEGRQVLPLQNLSCDI